MGYRNVIPIILILISLMSLAFFFSGSLPSTAMSFFIRERISALENDEYFPALVDSIHDARESIKVIMFEVKYYKNYKESKSNDILNALINASIRGVNVKIIIEGGEPFLGADFSKGQESACDYLTKNGIEVHYDERNRTTHAKLIIIDGEKVVIGSTNWNYYALEENNEASVLLIDRKIAEYFELYFEKLWKKSSVCTEA